jgi:hypothetical protein
MEPRLKEMMEYRKKVKASRELIMMEFDFYLSKSGTVWNGQTGLKAGKLGGDSVLGESWVIWE